MLSANTANLWQNIIIFIVMIEVLLYVFWPKSKPVNELISKCFYSITAVSLIADLTINLYCLVNWPKYLDNSFNFAVAIIVFLALSAMFIDTHHH